MKSYLISKRCQRPFVPPFYVNTLSVTTPFCPSPLFELAFDTPVHSAKMKKKYLAICLLASLLNPSGQGKFMLFRQKSGEFFQKACINPVTVSIRLDRNILLNLMPFLSKTAGSELNDSYV